MGIPTREQIANERPHAEGDADRLIGMAAYGLVGDFAALDRVITHPAAERFAAFYRSGEMLAGFADFGFGIIGGSRYQGAGVFGELAHVITNGLCLFVHNLGFSQLCLWWIMLLTFQGYVNG